MAIFEIPVPTSAYSSMTVDLDNQTFMLVFRWNTRETAWYMDLAEVDGTPIANGLKVVCNTDISGRFRAVGAPKGSLLFIGESLSALRPGRNELNGRVKLYYYDEAEITGA